MYCILSPAIALRSWILAPHAFYRRGQPTAEGLNEAEYLLAKECDGLHDIERGDTLDALISKGIVVPCEKGECALTEWQKQKAYDNRYFPRLNWMITGKCNYNCLHCFNAADNAPLMSEWTLPEAEALLDDARDCGINAFTITGGEPMLHKNFFEIIEGIYRRGMFVFELNTNGYFITDETLLRLKATGCIPLMKISFDGIGHHDWLRNRAGAEENALRAIKLCVKHGFPVKVQANVYRNNIESMLPTAQLMANIGVREMRIIRTTESPRWVQNAGGATLDLGEYYDHMLEFAVDYVKLGRSMSIDIWQFLTVWPEEHRFRVIPVLYSDGQFRDTFPVCKGNRGMIAIAANGNLFPCHQMSGYYEKHADLLGNVKANGLKKYLQESAYLDTVCETVASLAQKNEKCSVCRYFTHCAGGCRAIALAMTDDKHACDPAKCLFFENGYYGKIVRALDGFLNMSPMREPE